jgi:hypothetical protein
MAPAEFPQWLHVALGAAGVGLQLLIALAAFYRFRLTPSGLTLAGASLGSALALGAGTLLRFVLWQDAAWHSSVRLTASLGQSLILLLVGLAMAAGVALIPASLRRLRP